MATGRYDENGFWIYGEDDLADEGQGFSSVLNKSALAVRSAVPNLVRSKVADELEADPAYRAAAIQAFDEEVANRNLTEAESGTDGWLFAILWADNREVAIGKRVDGTWYPPELNAAVADQAVGFTSEDQGWRIVAYYEDTQEVAWGLRTDGTWYPATLGGGASSTSPGITVFGDSLTAGWAAYIADLGTTFKVPVRAIGDGGHRSGWIAARQGGQPLRLTVTGGALPASGPVDVTIAFATQLGTTETAMPAATFPGVVAGVPCALTITGNGTGRLTRNNPGRPVPVPANSLFTTGLAWRAQWPIFWAGRNNFKLANDGKQIVEDTRRMIAWTERRDRALVFSILPWEGEPIGSGVRGVLDAVNASLRDEFPGMFEDIGARLRSVDVLAAIGINATADDIADIQNGYTPRSLRLPNDAGHLNEAGYRALNLITSEIYKSRGWLS